MGIIKLLDELSWMLVRPKNHSKICFLPVLLGPTYSFLHNEQSAMTYHFLPRVSWVEGCPVRQLDTQLLIDKKGTVHTHKAKLTQN